MKKIFAANLFILAAFMALPLFAESKAPKMESLVQEASVKKIKKMIISNPSLADASYGESKDSLLIVALKNKRGHDVIRLLLDAGVNPKKQNADGDTAVTYAAKCGADAKILDELISYDTVLPFQRKSRITKKNKEGKNALDYASQSQNQEQIDVINRYLGVVDKAKDEPVVEAPAAEVAEQAAPAEPAPEPVAEPAVAQAPAPQPEPVAQETAAAAAGATAIAATAALAPQPEPEQEQEPEAQAAETLAPANNQDLQKAAAESAANAKKANRRLYLFEGIEAFDTYSAAQEKKRSLIAEPNKSDANGRTLLHKAASEDDMDMISLLHDSKANFNLADREGYTPLMYAARFAKRPETVALLLSYGADIKAKNRFGLSAIEIAAADNKNPQVVEALLARSQAMDSKKAFVAAVGMGRSSDTLQKFLDAGMNANEVYKGKTLLMYAAESNSDTNCIKFLLEKGADKTMLSTDWKDAYWFASQNPSLPHNDVYWSLNNKESD